MRLALSAFQVYFSYIHIPPGHILRYNKKKPTIRVPCYVASTRGPLPSSVLLNQLELKKSCRQNARVKKWARGGCFILGHMTGVLGVLEIHTSTGR